MSIILDMFLNEKDLSTKDRKKLKDSDFGIPEERKYPLIDKNHIIMAVRYFNKADKKYYKTLANNINKRAKELGLKINISKDNPFYKYSDKEIIK